MIAMIAATGPWREISYSARLRLRTLSAELSVNRSRTILGATAIGNAEDKSALKFGVAAVNPDGGLAELDFVIQAPAELPGLGFSCRYEVQPIGLTGEVTGANPLLAVRLAMFQLRTKLVHRYPDWRLLDSEGKPLFLDYDESA